MAGPRCRLPSSSVIGTLFTSVWEEDGGSRCSREAGSACARVEYSHPGNNEVGATGTNEELNSILMLQI